MGRKSGISGCQSWGRGRVREELFPKQRWALEVLTISRAPGALDHLFLQAQVWVCEFRLTAFRPPWMKALQIPQRTLKISHS